MNIKRKNKHEIRKMKKAAEILNEVFSLLIPKVIAGVTTKELDDFAEKQIISRGGYPAFKGVRGRVPYPATLCVSINDEIVHGIPGPRVLEEGDIIGVDCGAIWQEYYSDAAITIPVGKPAPETRRLMKATFDGYRAGVEKCVPGNRLGDVSHAIQLAVEGAGFNVVRDLYGHGIGRHLHEDPAVHNYGNPGEGPVLEHRMALAIEVMSCQFGYRMTTGDDGWTVKTADGGLSAHYEDTILITKTGPENLTGINGEEFIF